MEMNTLGKKICRHRKAKGYSQEELAELVGVSRQAISKWESGSSIPSTDNLRLLGNLYGVTVDFLLNSEENQQISEPPNTNENIPLSNEGLHSDKQRSRKRKAILLFVLVLVAAAAIVVTIYLVHESQITSVQEMEIEAQEEPSPPDTAFDIEW